MKRATLLLLSAAALLAGCADEFVSEEMLLGDEDKLRPLAVRCDPAEVSPGGRVELTFTYWDPHPDRTTIDWKVALDYDEGLYGNAPIERDYVDLAETGEIFDPVDDGNGIMTQRLYWTVPEDVLQNTSAIPAVLDEEPWYSMTQVVAPGRTLTRREMDEALAEISYSDMFWWEQEQVDAIWNVADLFAGRIRFRAQVRGGINLDVTRNLTVRHSDRLGSPNVNENTYLAWWYVVVVRAPDVDFGEIQDYDDVTDWYSLAPHVSGSALPIELHDDWTYYLSAEFVAQSYTSPFSGDERFGEIGRYRWYSFRLDDGDRGYPLIRAEDGDEAEMWELDEWVRIVPPSGGESSFRVFVCIRDERPEWSGWQGTPGVMLQGANIRFGGE